MSPSSLFKLLSDDTRLRVLLLLAEEELCVCELCGILEEQQPKISKILSKFRDLDLVHDVRKDKFVFYSINSNHEFLMSWLSFIRSDLKRYPELARDQQRLLTKENYLTTCVVPLRD